MNPGRFAYHTAVVVAYLNNTRGNMDGLRQMLEVWEYGQDRQGRTRGETQPPSPAAASPWRTCFSGSSAKHSQPKTNSCPSSPTVSVPKS